MQGFESSVNQDFEKEIDGLIQMNKLKINTVLKLVEYECITKTYFSE